MECFQTCVDQGNKCFFSKEKLTCIDCGKYRKGYCVPAYRCTTCHQTHNCKCPEVRCECAEQSCLEWFLSLFGLGQKKSTKDCCTATAGKEGEKTAQASETEPLEISVCRSKEGFAVTLQRIGSRHKCERSSKTSIHVEPSREEAEKKFRLEDSFSSQKPQAALITAGDEEKKHSEEKVRHKQGKEKSPKWTSSNSSTESRGRSRHRRRSKSKGKSGLKGKEGSKPVSASNSESTPGKVRSRSCSSSICSCSPIFKPYRHKYSFLKCSSYTPLAAPVHLCASPSFEAPSLGNKYSRAPSKPCPPAYFPTRSLQPSDCSPPQANPDPCEEKKVENKEKVEKKEKVENKEKVEKKDKAEKKEKVEKKVEKNRVVQSASMSCGSEAKKCCRRGPARPTLYPIYNPPCPYFCRLPCRSQSFHTTMVSGPSPRAVCIPNKISFCPCDSPCGRTRCRVPELCRKSRSCPRSCPCPIKSSCCSPPACFGTCCPKQSPCVKGGKNCTCCCVSGCKAIPCPPTCTKPCCLPCPRQFQVIPYCIRPTCTERAYRSISKCIKGSACPCPPGACLCAKPGQSPTKTCCNQLASINKPLCCTGFTASYIKSKQGDATCQQLLNKYGFSKTPNRCCPPICTGMTFCPNPCNTNLCKKMSKPSCMCNLNLGSETKSCCAARTGGCKSCRPCSDSCGHPSACPPAENYTNSRKPTSPNEKMKQIIQFNKDPCERPPRREFHLAPHCLRKTGPRSPVREFMDKMFVPKMKPPQPCVEDEDLEDDEAVEEKPAASPEKPKQEEGKEKEEVKEKEDDKEKDEEKEEPKAAEEGADVDVKQETESKVVAGAASGEKNISKKKKMKKSHSSRGKLLTDENASALNGGACLDGNIEHDIMLLVCDLCPTASVLDMLDDENLSLCINNNHGCQAAVPRHAHFSQSKFYPGYRFEPAMNDPYGNNCPLSMSAFATSREMRPTLDIYRLGSYAGPSFGFSTTCYNRPNDKRSAFDEKIFCTSRLSKNWNVTALNTTKFHTATYKGQRTIDPMMYRSFPKAIIYNMLESEIQRKIQLIKIGNGNAKNHPWRKQFLEMPPVVPMMGDEVPPRAGDEEQDQQHDPATGEFINASWKALKQRQSLRQSVRPSVPHDPATARMSMPMSVRYSEAPNKEKEESEEKEENEQAAQSNEEPYATNESERKDSCGTFVCNSCNNDNNDKEAKQSNCNKDISSIACSEVSLHSRDGNYRKDVSSPEKNNVTVLLSANGAIDNDKQRYGKESSVDGLMYEDSQRATPTKENKIGDESGNACIKSQPETEVVKPSAVLAAPELQNFLDRIDETLHMLTQTKLNFGGTQDQESNVSKLVEDCPAKCVDSRPSAPSCSAVSSNSLMTVTSSATISMVSVSNVESMPYQDQHRFSVARRISSVRKQTRSRFGVEGGESPTRGCETPVKLLVRYALAPKDACDTFQDSEKNSCFQGVYDIGSRANSRISSDADFLANRSVSRASEAWGKGKCRELLVSGSSVDPVEMLGNESQNHPSLSVQNMGQGAEEIDQLLSLSRAHVTELQQQQQQCSATSKSVPAVSTIIEEPEVAEEPQLVIPSTDSLVDFIRNFGTPV